ncbi:hypothetical protein B0T24DRAFT_628173 [Lasiosphaeria ovina]|uniref:PDZ domain-containing protein n=1 Tax=Lasiosphaeria ovina TaxID=92902 RepID=A0AAE0N6H0_9PEZI|nr:hypothetical protein B0T24DRAFT_628173 [Lasiosphaeria ovina]
MNIETYFESVVSLKSTNPFPAAGNPAQICHANGVFIGKSIILAPFGSSAPMSIMACLDDGRELLVTRRQPLPGMTGGSLLTVDHQVDNLAVVTPPEVKVGDDVWVLGRNTDGTKISVQTTVAQANKNPPCIDKDLLDYNKTYFLLATPYPMPRGAPVFTRNNKCIGFCMIPDTDRGSCWAVLASKFDGNAEGNMRRLDLGVIWVLREAGGLRQQYPDLPKGPCRFLVAERAITECSVEAGDVLESADGVRVDSFEGLYDLPDAEHRKLVLRRSTTQATVVVTTIDLGSEMISSVLNIESVCTLVEHGLLPPPTAGFFCPPRTLYIESSSDETLEGRHVVEANGKPVALLAEVAAQINSPQVSFGSKCACASCPNNYMTSRFELGAKARLWIGEPTDTGFWAFKPSTISLKLPGSISPSGPTGWIRQLIRGLPKWFPGDPRVEVQPSPPSVMDCPTPIPMDQASCTGYVFAEGFLVTSTSVAPMMGYEVTLIYKGQRVPGIVSEVSIRGFAVVKFDPEDLKDLSPPRISKLNPGWLTWVNWDKGAGYCFLWTTSARHVVNDSLGAACSGRQLANIVSMHPSTPESSLWLNSTFTSVRAVTIDGESISAADILTLVDPTSRLLPVLFETVSSTQVGPLTTWFKTGRFGTDTYLRVKAAKAGCGLESGDVVVAVDNKPVPSSLSFKADSVSVKAIRSGKIIDHSVVTILHSKFERHWSFQWKGLILQPVPLEHSNLMKVSPTGLHICRVQPGSPAESWGITAPSYLLSIDNTSVIDTKLQEFTKLIQGINGEQGSVDLKIQDLDGQASLLHCTLSPWLPTSSTYCGERQLVDDHRDHSDHNDNNDYSDHSDRAIL